MWNEKNKNNPEYWFNKNCKLIKLNRIDWLTDTCTHTHTHQHSFINKWITNKKNSTANKQKNS